MVTNERNTLSMSLLCSEVVAVSSEMDPHTVGLTPSMAATLFPTLPSSMVTMALVPLTASLTESSSCFIARSSSSISVSIP